MRRITLLIVFSYFGVLFSFAQDLSIDWGTSFDSNTDVQKILGFSGKKMVVFSSKGKKRYIEEYDEKGFGQLSSNEYDMPDIPGQSVGLLNITISEENVLVVLYGYNKKTKSFSLYTQSLGTNGKEKSKLDEFYTSEGDEDKIKDAIVDVRFSPDNSKMLVFFDRANKERTKFMSDIVMIDLNDLKNITDKSEEYTMRDSKAESVTFRMAHTIDNEGAFFFISQRTEFAKKAISNFELNVKGYNSKGDKIGESEVADQECLFLNPNMIKTDQGYTMVGYYMTNPKKRAIITGYTGLFVAKFDKGVNLKDIKKNDFTDEFFKDLYSERYIRRMTEKQKEIQVPAPYSIDNIVLHTDGTMTILSEFFLVTVSDNGKGQKTTTTNYGNIIYYKLSTDGNITKADVVKKNQISSTSSIGIGIGGGALSMFMSFETKDQRKKYWSYSLAIKGDLIYLLFNDHRKNMLNEDGEISASLANPAKGLPYLVEITEDGNFTKKAMADASDEDTYCVPQITYQTEAEEFIIWGVKRKENKFGKATIN
ncbi:hypothetical protein [Fluviicola sp.]|uniref:hypothetical protein n=1 Tax=Fluviicola sp. TaxID=1917219 RepID=UPI003D27CFF2